MSETGADATSSRLILLIHDVEETRRLLMHSLQLEGYGVIAAATEQDAAVSARERSAALILVDVPGPVRNAAEAGARIRRRAGVYESVPVVVIGIETLADGAEIDIGAGVHLVRPENLTQLKIILSRLLSRRLLPPL